MSLPATSYLALSALAYEDLSNVDPSDTKQSQVSKLVDASSKPEYSALSSLSSWQLISHKPNTASGFSASAFRNPATGEIVFAFRGSEPTKQFGIDATHADVQLFMQSPDGFRTSQFAEAESFVSSVLSKHPDASYSFTGHSLGGALAQYMTYATKKAGKTGVGKTVSFNAPGIGKLIENMHGGSVDPKEYEGLVTDYVNESDTIGNYANDKQLGTTITIRSRLNSLVGQDVANILNMLTMFSSSNGQLSMLEMIALVKKALKSGKNIADNAVLTGNHGLDDLLDDQGRLMPQVQSRTAGSRFVGYIAEGTYHAASGGKFAIVTIGDTAGGIIYYSAEGVTKFINTSGYIINQLAYHGTDGVMRFVDTSEYIWGGLGYYAIEGVQEFFEHAGDGIAAGTWQSFSFARGLFADALSAIRALFGDAAAAAPVRVDPLILDLDGDGIETTSLALSKTYFDTDSNGFAELTGWASADDGMLALDRNNNGSIDNGQELFGDWTVLQNGVVATNGFEALAEFDDNADGVIDTNDSVFARLRVWRDANNDGISDASELKSLTELGIQSISLGSVATQVTDAMNNIQRRLGSFQWTNGATGAIGEYLLARDTSRTRESSDDGVAIPDDIAALPNLQGAGNVVSLHRAMTKDTSGQLQDLVQAFVAAPNTATREQLLPQIIYHWAGVAEVDPASRGGNIDARQLAVLERFLGTGFIGTSGTSPNTSAAPLLKEAYNQFYERIYSTMISRSTIKDLIGTLQYESTDDGIVVDFSQAIAALDAQLSTDRDAGIEMLAEFSRALKGHGLQTLASFDEFRQHFMQQSIAYVEAIDTVGPDTIRGSDNRGDTLRATNAAILAGLGNNDYLRGSTGNDTLYGGAGHDSLQSKAGNDTLVGGTGDDWLYGGDGDDVYLFSIGDGKDTIYESDGTDTIRFGAGIAPEDVIIKRVYTGSDYNLVLRLAGTDDSLTVKRHFGYRSSGLRADPKRMIERIEFANGTVWTPATLEEKLHNLTGTDKLDRFTAYDDAPVTYRGMGGDDQLQGGAGNDTLYGGAGHDSLQSKAGNDTLVGGTGDDWLYGGDGDDTYVFSGEFGTDTISDSSGDDLITIDRAPEKLVFQRNGSSLQVSTADSSDSIRVASWYQNTDRHIETFKASDGSTISSTQVEQLIQAMASWSSDNGGMSWSQALENSQDIHAIISQYWTAPTA